MRIPCDQHVDCECNPLLTNYSAEDPDRFLFLARRFPRPGVPPLKPPTRRDPTTCVTFASSPVTQEDAEACAERHEVECEVGTTITDPCEVCTEQPIQTGNNASFGGFQATTPTGDCCDPDAPQGCCCVDVPGNPDIPEDPDDPDNPPLFPNSPQTCTSMCPDGTVSSFTVRAGFFVSTSQILSDRQALSFACREARRLRVCIAPFDGVSCADPESANPPESQQLFATSTLPIVAWALASGSLPTGITLDPATGLMSGQPTEAGTFDFVIQATSSAGIVATRAMTWNILGFVTEASLPDAEVGVAYSQQLIADGGAITFEITAGSLPAGLTMDDTGLISGTPTTAVTDQEFSVSVTDNFLHTCEQQFLLSAIVTCIPDTDCNLPVSFYSCVLPSNLVVSDWATKKAELIAPTADPAGVQPEFDGTFPIQDQATFPGFTYWVTAGSVPPVWTDFSVNGLFIQALYVQSTNVSTPHLLRFRGTVGGVPTAIWEGTKTTGENPIGTYMRTAGLSAGPECFHVTGPVTPKALAWWEMGDVPATDQTDAVCGLHLNATGVIAEFSSVAGHVSQAVQIACGSTGPPATHTDALESSNAGLKFNGSGVTICGWVNLSDTVGDANNEVSILYRFDQNGVTYLLQAQRRGLNGDDWKFTLDGAGTLTIPSAAGWHFIVLTFNGTTGEIGCDIDQSGMSNEFILIPPAGSNVNGQFILEIFTDPAKIVTGIFDEFTIYNDVLTTVQLDCIYNGGTGRTW